MLHAKAGMKAGMKDELLSWGSPGRELAGAAQPPALDYQKSGPPIMAAARSGQPPALDYQKSGPPIMAV